MQKRKCHLQLVGTEDPTSVFDDLDRLKQEQRADWAVAPARHRRSPVFRTTRGWRSIAIGSLLQHGSC